MRWRLSIIGLFVVALGLAGCAPNQNLSSLASGLAEPTSEQDIADAKDRNLWGIYADLPGQVRSSTRDGGTDISWRWIKPGRVLQENWHVTGQASPVKIITLWRGEQTGVLYA